MSATTARISDFVNEYGFSGLLQKAFSKFVYKKTNIVLLELDLNKPRKNYRGSKLWTSRRFAAADLAACKAHFDSQTQAFEEFLDIGYHGFGSFCTTTGDLVAIIWFTDKDYYDKHYYRTTFPTKPGQVFQFAAEVALPFRNKHVSAELSNLGWKEMHAQGAQSSYCSVDQTNTPSLRIQFHLGFEEIGEIIEMHELFKFRWFTKVRYEENRFDHLNKHKRKR